MVAALEKIDKFNQEETAFGWENKQYPLRKEVADRLAPYKKLYDAASDFLTKYDKWTTSTIGVFDPEEIENDVSTSLR